MSLLWSHSSYLFHSVCRISLECEDTRHDLRSSDKHSEMFNIDYRWLIEGVLMVSFEIKTTMMQFYTGCFSSDDTTLEPNNSFIVHINDVNKDSKLSPHGAIL